MRIDVKRRAPPLKRRAPPLKRVATRVSRAPIVAYDLETTNIAEGTPELLWLTAYGEEPAFEYAGPLRGSAHFLGILIAEFLTPERAGVRYVAWNANRYDAYFVAQALLLDTRFTVRPYLTRSKSVRGMRVVRSCDVLVTGRIRRGAPVWEFLDGCSMLGLAGTSLGKFLECFAPDHKKLTGVIDWETESFDGSSPAHREYAMRDSVGLWHALARAQAIMIEGFGQALTPTIGGACIRILRAHIPTGVVIPSPRNKTLEILRAYVARGGYCHCVRRYRGPIWKYDINQAYAAAMRETDLPCGEESLTDGPGGLPYMVRLRASKPSNTVPFYYRTARAGKMFAEFAMGEICDTWITSIEHEQLIAEDWYIDEIEFVSWEGSFRLSEYVDKLETGRFNAPGGPQGPVGLVYKYIGCHSYGKTLERIEHTEYLLAKKRPPGFFSAIEEPKNVVEQCIWSRLDDDPRDKDHHKPQIGSWITAHVRMVMRRAILLDSAAWLYADTDCLVFNRDMGDRLDIHPTRYGAWKVEESGTPYTIIAKKVYTEESNRSTRKRAAKGMNVKRLSADDFNKWYEGSPPVQEQLQRNNFLSVVIGEKPMFKIQQRTGTTSRYIKEK